MSAISSLASLVRQPRNSLLLTAAIGALLLAAVTVGTGTAAASPYYWTYGPWADNTTTSASAGCTQMGYGTVPRTWEMHASEWSSYSNTSGYAYMAGDHRVEFAVLDAQRNQWVAIDSAWRQIPQTAFGLSLYGRTLYNGVFYVYARFWHPPYGTTNWQFVGSMRWVYDAQGRLFCIN